MMIGTVTKQEGIWWSAHCDIAGIFTQGKSKADAMRALADAFEDVIHRDGFRVTVTALDGDEVHVTASDPALLLGVVLRYQREAHGLSLADVAKRLGASSRNAYARYEHGTAMPKLDTAQAILQAVAPELALTVGPRKPTRSAPPSRAKAKRRGPRA
jgi:DNA-binding XRE family transcriptional regulator